MNDILFGNNNSKVITKLSKRYFKKNKVRNLAALLAIILTAFLFTSITSLRSIWRPPSSYPCKCRKAARRMALWGI